MWRIPTKGFRSREPKSSATGLSLTGYVWTLVWGDGQGWGKDIRNRVLSEATHCCLTLAPVLRAVSQQGLVQWSWKMSQQARLRKGPCSLAPRMSCVRRAVWIIEAETGGLGLWEKGGRVQDEGRRRYPSLQCTPQVALWVEALKPVQVQVIFWLEKQNKTTATRQKATHKSRAKEKSYRGGSQRPVPRRGKSRTLHEEKSIWPLPSHPLT